MKDFLDIMLDHNCPLVLYVLYSTDEEIQSEAHRILDAFDEALKNGEDLSLPLFDRNLTNEEIAVKYTTAEFEKLALRLSLSSIKRDPLIAMLNGLDLTCYDPRVYICRTYSLDLGSYVNAWNAAYPSERIYCLSGEPGEQFR